MSSSRLPLLTLGIVFALLLGYAGSMRVLEHKIYFFSDEATYHSMAYSLAHDGDLEYRRGDLERVYELGYENGPTGLFLKRHRRSGRLHFAKALLYPAVAAPFVGGLGDNGFYVLHALLAGLAFAAGFAYLRRGTSPGVAALYTLTYLLASVAFAYFFWMSPEWFNLVLVFVGCFLWLHKLPRPGGAPVPAADEGDGSVGGRPGGGGPRAGRGSRGPARRAGAGGFLDGGWTDVAAAVLFGMAAYSKPTNAVFLLPLVAHTAFRGRWRRAVALGLVGALTIAALFGVTWGAIGDWNYQGGERKTFYFDYPLQSRAATFDRLGNPMTTNPGDVWIPDARTLASNLIYVWIGRNSGLLVYMFPAVLAVLLFAARCRRRPDTVLPHEDALQRLPRWLGGLLSKPGIRWLRSPHVLLGLACAVNALAYLLLVSNNWIGGGGALGNRYFMTFYPALFFLLPAAPGLGGAAVAWVVAGLFLAQILMNPFTASHNPASHTKAFPATLLPAELTLLHNLPFNTNPRARRVPMGDPTTHFLYFLDDDTYFREPGAQGFWVRGERTAEVVLRSVEPLERIELAIRNGAAPNRISVTLGGERHRRRLDGGETTTFTFTPGPGLAYEDSYLYRFTVSTSDGFVPWLENPDATPRDNRYLGALVRARIDPAVPIR